MFLQEMEEESAEEREQRLQQEIRALKQRLRRVQAKVKEEHTISKSHVAT